MFERELAVFRFMQGYAHDLMADLSDEEWFARPTPKMSHAAWLIGHLCAVHDSLGAMFCGEDRRLDPSWHGLFKGGSAVLDDASAYPEPAALKEAYDAGHAWVQAVVPGVTAEVASSPNPRERMKAALPTTGDFLAFVLTSHESVHLGQLSATRRGLGRDPLF